MLQPTSFCLSNAILWLNEDIKSRVPPPGCQTPHIFSQKPRISSRPKNLPAQTSGPLKQNVAFDIFSETERGVWQTRPL
ncbi:hypothetical protein HMPREF9069_00196 [Atopobium sp. oral taxon 810 str. F0209]|nr:hypothetical protein HMPREF9069_00196 [Atopobium sp. oral taxon 810 str. F0209]